VPEDLAHALIVFRQQDRFRSAPRARAAEIGDRPSRGPARAASRW
jgi:hypothetical protein